MSLGSCYTPDEARLAEIKELWDTCVQHTGVNRPIECDPDDVGSDAD